MGAQFFSGSAEGMRSSNTLFSTLSSRRQLDAKYIKKMRKGGLNALFSKDPAEFEKPEILEEVRLFLSSSKDELEKETALAMLNVFKALYPTDSKNLRDDGTYARYHLLYVAYLAMNLGADVDGVLQALFHDAKEDGKVKNKEEFVKLIKATGPEQDGKVKNKEEFVKLIKTTGLEHYHENLVDIVWEEVEISTQEVPKDSKLYAFKAQLKKELRPPVELVRKEVGMMLEHISRQLNSRQEFPSADMAEVFDAFLHDAKKCRDDERRKRAVGRISALKGLFAIGKRTHSDVIGELSSIMKDDISTEVRLYIFRKSLISQFKIPVDLAKNVRAEMMNSILKKLEDPLVKEMAAYVIRKYEEAYVKKLYRSKSFVAIQNKEFDTFHNGRTLLRLDPVYDFAKIYSHLQKVLTHIDYAKKVSNLLSKNPLSALSELWNMLEDFLKNNSINMTYALKDLRSRINRHLSEDSRYQKRLEMVGVAEGPPRSQYVPEGSYSYDQRPVITIYLADSEDWMKTVAVNGNEPELVQEVEIPITVNMRHMGILMPKKINAGKTMRLIEELYSAKGISYTIRESYLYPLIGDEISIILGLNSPAELVEKAEFLYKHNPWDEWYNETEAVGREIQNEFAETLVRLNRTLSAELYNLFSILSKEPNYLKEQLNKILAKLSLRKKD
ncbi:MAG: hypothetical protein ABIH83_00345 [Candidatus Micrarchaeota archaeon]